MRRMGLLTLWLAFAAASGCEPARNGRATIVRSAQPAVRRKETERDMARVFCRKISASAAPPRTNHISQPVSEKLSSCENEAVVFCLQPW